MRVLLATDSFPPGCGGSGWSTFELAKGLRARGHEVLVFLPRPGEAGRRRDYEGFDVIEHGAPAPNLPFVRNYFKNERLYASLRKTLAHLVTDSGIDIVHAQHRLTGPPAIDGAHQARRPAVCTVRDYWPVCYWSDLIHDPTAEGLCPACTAAGMTRCLRPRAGSAWPLALPMIPYMRRNLRVKREALARAERVIAVSSTIAADLRARASELHPGRLVHIPNPVDVEAIVGASHAAPPAGLGPYAVYVGKLAPNKGTRRLIEAVDAAALPWPLVVVGDGPDRGMVEDWARSARSEVRLTGWLPRADAHSWLAHASLLIFPSYGPESLSRVLLEAATLGIPTAAMDTGGTRDIVLHGVTGLLSQTAAGLARDIKVLVEDRALAERLALAARAHVAEHFAAERVVARVEALYRDVLAEWATQQASTSPGRAGA
jgi:glycosyltransferase involved in cell wall biosynthesis